MREDVLYRSKSLKLSVFGKERSRGGRPGVQDEVECSRAASVG